MNIRFKAAVIVIVAVVCLIVVVQALYISSVAMLVSQNNASGSNERSNETAANDIVESLNRASAAIDGERSQLEKTALSMSAWDKTFDFMSKPITDAASVNYIAQNLDNNSFVRMDISFVLYVKDTGKFVYQKAVNLSNSSAISFPTGLEDHLKNNTDMLNVTNSTRSMSGILLLPEGPVLIAAYPILKSNLDGDSPGTLIMGKFLDESRLQYLSGITQAEISLAALYGSNSSEYQNASSQILNGTINCIQSNSSSIACYRGIYDIYGSKSVILEAAATLPASREISTSNPSSAPDPTIAFIASGVIFACLMIFLLEAFVFSRLSSLGKSVESISTTQNPSARVPVRGKDEINTLAIGINEMLASIEKSSSDLKDSEAKYHSVVDQSPEAIILVDPSNKAILEANKAFGLLLGYDPTNIQQLTLYDIMQDIRALGGSDLSSAISNGDLHQRDGNFIRNDGTVARLEVTASPINIGGKSAICFLLRDISERIKAEEGEASAKKLEAVGTLAGGIAHDFNNILTAVIGNLTLAKMNTDPSSQSYARITEAEKVALRAKTLTNELLTFSRGGNPIKIVTSVADLVEDNARSALLGSNITHTMAVGQDIPAVEIDPDQVGRAINNIVINAREAMPEGGKVLISIENANIEEGEDSNLRAGRYVKVSIRDEGVGMSTKVQEKIFEPYFTTKKKGSGLGLAVAYAVIKKHDGDLKVESIEGKGSTFFIFLPASSKTLQVSKEKPIEERGKGRVLLMDDEDFILDVTGEVLKQIGYRVDFAHTGEEALDEYKRGMESDSPFDAVIMDLVIPNGMGGKEAIQMLKAIDPNAKAIVSSGYSDDPVMANYQDYGFSGVIPKPYRIADLHKLLHNVISANS